MRDDLITYEKGQVFLNYPSDVEFRPLANAMHFAVVAAGLIPVCIHDLSASDRPRLETIIDAIVHCRYSVHDFSQSKDGEDSNFIHFNRPIEMGMALFHALHTQRRQNRCSFFVSAQHDHLKFPSDLASLDPTNHYNEELLVVTEVYKWLYHVGKPLVNDLSIVDVKEKYLFFKEQLNRVEGSEKNGLPSHDESQELMYKICSECKWWEWRDTRLGKLEFPRLPLSWKISTQPMPVGVFLCHNSHDKSEVKKIGEALKQRGIRPWLDEWELQPGLPWQRTLEAQIASISSTAVFVGKDGVGPWQHMELEALLQEFVQRGCSVVPVLLASASEKPSLPLFLRNMVWVDFRREDPDPMNQLIWGITGKKPDMAKERD